MEFKIAVAMKMGCVTVTVILLIVGLIGNALVIYIVSGRFRMRTVTNIYLLCLSIVDIFHLISIIFVCSTVVLEQFVFGTVLCRISLALEGINWFAGTFILTALSIDRFIAVCHPTRAISWRTVKTALVVVVIIFLICIVLLSPLAVYAEIKIDLKNHSVNQTEYAKHYCTLMIPTENRNLFTLSMFSIGFAVPVLCMIIFYTMIYRKLQFISHHNTALSINSRKSMKSITRFAFLLIVIYVLFWLPYWVNQLFVISRLFTNWRVMLYIGIMTQFLGYLNSALNPLWYAFMSKQFRTMYLEVATCTSFNDSFLKLFGE
uniref:GCR366 n=1 Tax=Schmidtea mediterranea TaxID=79327 RepID=A0A193KUG8_SCHMD|nr:GCR366 [Schmidtea mediterranea]